MPDLVSFDRSLLIEHSPDIYYRIRLVPDRGFEYVSPAVTAITGYTPADHYADPDLGLKIVHPDDRDFVLRGIDGVLDDHQTLLVRWIRRDGVVIWTQQRTRIVRNAAGGAIAIEGVARDITAQIQAQTCLDRYRLLAEHMRDAALFVRPNDGRILEVNTAVVDLYGYSREQLLTMTLADLLPPDGHQRLRLHMSAASAGAVLYEAEYKRADGSLFPAEVSATATVINGDLTQLHLVHNISMRQRTSSERDLLRIALEEAANAVVITNIDGLIIWANPAFTALTGYSLSEVHGRKTAVLRSGHHDIGFYQHLWETVLSGKAWRGELVNRRKDASLYIEEMTITPVIQGGKITHFIAIKQEVTKRVEQAREREALLSLAEALRSSGSRAELLPTLLARSIDLVRADAAALAMRDPASGDAIFEQGIGGWEEFGHTRLLAGRGVTGRVLQTGELYHNNDVLHDPAIARPELFNGIQAAVCAPLHNDDRVIGALWMGRKSAFSPADARMVGAIADLAAGAIARAMLSEQTERRLQRLTSLRAIDHAITNNLDVRVSLNVLLDHCIQQLGVDAAAVLTLNSHSLTLEHAASRGFRSTAILSTHLRIGEGLAGRAVRERRTIVVAHVSEVAGQIVRRELVTVEGFVSYSVVPLIAKGQVRGALEVFRRTAFTPDREWLDFLETLAGQAAVAIDNAELFQHMQRASLDMALAYDTTLEGWSRALELRDKETEGHSQRVTSLTLRLARAMGLSDKELVHIRRGALLHDIGKMGIPDAILLKPGSLTEAEREVIKLHPGYAYDLLRPIAFLRPALDIPYCHHEKWDGSGYPQGLRGAAIPLAARIFAIVDVFDAATSDRPYQKACSRDQARAMLIEESGHHFDPQVVTAFLRLLDEDEQAQGG